MNKQLYKRLEKLQENARSKWERGVYDYALEMVEIMIEEERDLFNTKTFKELTDLLLLGAEDWNAYSWGGSSLVANKDIRERLATPSVIKQYSGSFAPGGVEWLDVQVRALKQASCLIDQTVGTMKFEESKQKPRFIKRSK